MRLTTVPCVACNGPNSKPDPFYYQWNGRVFRLFRCPDCTHQFVHPPVSSADQAAIYGDHYFDHGGDWSCGVFASSYCEAEHKLREEARSILALLPRPPARLLDIGCAGGVFLDEARAHGFDVAGIELNAQMASRARSLYGLDVTTARIEDACVSNWVGAFDVVTLLDVLEHVPCPRLVILRVSSWLRPGGTIFVRGPLVNTWTARAKERVRRLVRIPKRLPGYPLDANNFNKRSLGTLLTSTGFRVQAWPGENGAFSNLVARKT